MTSCFCFASFFLVLAMFTFVIISFSSDWYFTHFSLIARVLNCSLSASFPGCSVFLVVFIPSTAALLSQTISSAPSSLSLFIMASSSSMTSPRSDLDSCLAMYSGSFLKSSYFRISFSPLKANEPRMFVAMYTRIVNYTIIL